MARLRLSAHNLHIETGRYNSLAERKEPENRICMYCNQGACEDEFHFIIKCSLYDVYREELYKYVTDRFPFFIDYRDTEQFIWLMSSLDAEIIKAVTLFNTNCFIRRKRSKCISVTS